MKTWTALVCLYVRVHVCLGSALLANDLAEDLEDDYDSCKSLTETYVIADRKFIFFTQRVTWDEANIICPSYKAKLAVLDSADKAMGLTKTWAQSDLVYIDSMWVGARKYPATNWTWTWVTGQAVPEQGDNDYPYWKRRKFRDGKDCMALMRRGHKDPTFADLSCRLTRPFICEMQVSTSDEDSVPMPTNWLKCKTVFLTLYNAEVTWEKALAFCRNHGKRLARMSDSLIEWQLRMAMTKSRPAMEMVWMGARSVQGQWRWVSDGIPIPAKKDPKTGYPPWLDERESSKEGCLVLDKHFCNPAAFVSLPCNKKRSFACEEYLVPPEPNPKQVAYEFPCGTEECVLVGLKKNWADAMAYCKSEYSTTLVKLVNRKQTSLIADAMADHPSEIKHAWIGGYHEPKGEWKWVVDNSLISLVKAEDSENQLENQSIFPPWCYLEQNEIGKQGELCLNMDRTIYRSYIMYGLGCNATQSFVCIKNSGHRDEISQEQNPSKPENSNNFIPAPKTHL